MKIQEFAIDMQLINVAEKGDLRNMADYPYGMAVIAGYLREKGFDVLMCQYPKWKKGDYLNRILDNPAYLYGFQVNFENYTEIKDLVAIIKESNPRGKIIFGGPFVISLYEDLLKNDPDLDAIVLGEGEFTIAELIRLLKEDSPDWRFISGVAWLDENNKVVMNPHRPVIQDLDKMPFAARDGVRQGDFDLEGKYMHDVRITTSRGCTSNCTFCAVNVNSRLQKGKRWRGRSPVNVTDEIQELVEKYNVKLLNLQDSAFEDPGTLGLKRNRELCEEILKRNLGISMKVYYRAHSIKGDPESIELYKLYKEAGVDVIIIGAEAGSDYELEIYGKTARLEDNYRSFKVLQDLGLFFVHIGFIMFGPYSTLPTLRDNIHFLYNNQLCFYYYHLSSILLLTPGTAAHDSIKREGRLLPGKNYWEIPNYEYTNPDILRLAQHYQDLRERYLHLDIGGTLVINASNIISRLKNKMNEKVVAECKEEVDMFEEIFSKKRNELNELGYHGFTENLDLIEKEGLRADLMCASEPYFGRRWGDVILEIQQAYQEIIDSIQSKGFGLGGLIYNAEFSSLLRNT